jgi:hypothetical protein
VHGRVEPDVQRRLLSRELRSARGRNGHTQLTAALALEWSLSKFIRIERGETGVSITDLRALLSYYKIHDPDYITRLEELARTSRYRPFDKYRDVINKPFAKYLGHEAAADGILQYQHFLIPGLLQVEEYARAVLSANIDDERKVELTVELRAERQKRFMQPDSGRTASFIIDEGSLHRLIGGPSVMATQLQHLLKTAEAPSVQIRVVPFSAGAHRGLTTSFVLLEFAQDPNADVVFLESADEDSRILDDQEAIDLYKTRFESMRSLAVDAREFEPLTSIFHTAEACA